MYWTKTKVVVLACLGFITGTALASFIAVPSEYLYTLGLAGLVLTFLGIRSRAVLVVGLVMLLASIGIARYILTEPVYDEGTIQYYNEHTVTFEGVVTSEPDIRSNHTKLTVRASSLVGGEMVRGKVLVNTRLYPAYSYGDQLKISCQLQAPRIIASDDGRDFHYDQYLARFSIFSVCYRPTIEFVAHDQGSPVMAAVLNVKRLFTERVTTVIAEPEASFVGGLILGARKSIPDELIEAFSLTGTTHIIALSGYNITIIAVFIQNLCLALRINRRYGFWIALVAIGLFIVLTGAPASIVRAGIMGGLVLVARQLGRMNRITNALFIAAVIMLIINPRVLVFDAGFQLSFLATIGLVYLSPLLEKVFRWMPSVFELRASLVATLSAIILTTPLILYIFGRLSLVAPLVNMIILPMIPFAMALGFLTGIASIIFIPLGQLVGWISWGLLRFILLIIEWFATLPYISYQLPVIHWGWMVILYVSMGAVMWRQTKKPPAAQQPTVVL